MKVTRPLVLAGAGLVVVLGAAAGGFALIFLGHQAPAPYAPAASAASSSASVSPGGLVGSWTIAAGSEAGYRVREQFASLASPTEAVARTSSISGSLTIEGQGSQLVARGALFSADLTKLRSADRYAVYQALQRDFFVGNRFLQTNVYPTATFRADRIALPANAAAGGPIQFIGSGQLTLHGMTRTVQVPLTAQLSDSRIELVGSFGVELPDYGISPPDVGFTRAESHALIEFHLFLTR